MINARLRKQSDGRSERRVRVLYYVGYWENFAGSQRSVAMLAENLPADMECLALFPGRGEAAEYFEAAGIPTRILETRRSLTEFGGALLSAPWHRWVRVFVRDVVPQALRLLRLLKEEAPDVVHCGDARALLQIGWAARVARIPVVWHLQGENVLQCRPLVNWVAGRLASCIIVVAEALADSAPKDRPISVVHYGLDRRSVPDQSVRQRIAHELCQRGFDRRSTVVVLTASSFVPFKGLHHLVPALGAVVGEMGGGQTAVWLLLGSEEGTGRGKYARYLRGLAEWHGVERHMLWMGWVPDAMPWMEAADLVVLPTVAHEALVYPDGEQVDARFISEGFPLTVLEAMASGRPVIASDVGGVREALGPECGVLVSAGDEEALTRALRRLAVDEELRKAMGRHGAYRAGSFPVNEYVRKTCEVYRSLVAARAL